MYAGSCSCCCTRGGGPPLAQAAAAAWESPVGGGGLKELARHHCSYQETNSDGRGGQLPARIAEGVCESSTVVGAEFEPGGSAAAEGTEIGGECCCGTTERHGALLLETLLRVNVEAEEERVLLPSTTKSLARLFDFS